jgi:hypothetical protein
MNWTFKCYLDKYSDGFLGFSSAFKQTLSWFPSPKMLLRASHAAFVVRLLCNQLISIDRLHRSPSLYRLSHSGSFFLIALFYLANRRQHRKQNHPGYKSYFGQSPRKTGTNGHIMLSSTLDLPRTASKPQKSTSSTHKIRVWDSKVQRSATRRNQLNLVTAAYMNFNVILVLKLV